MHHRDERRLLNFAAISAILFALLGLLTEWQTPLPGEVATIELVQRSGWFEPIAHFFEGPLDAWGLPFIVATGALIAIFRRRLDYVMLFVLAQAAAPLNLLFKVIYGRERPSEANGEIALESFSSTADYPSGHSLAAILCFGVLGFIAWRHTSGAPRIAAVAALAVLVMLAGYSRMSLGVHWPTDVLGGFLLGVACIALLIAFVQRAARPTAR